MKYAVGVLTFVFVFAFLLFVDSQIATFISRLFDNHDVGVFVGLVAFCMGIPISIAWSTLAGIFAYASTTVYLDDRKHEANLKRIREKREKLLNNRR